MNNPKPHTPAAIQDYRQWILDEAQRAARTCETLSQQTEDELRSFNGLWPHAMSSLAHHLRRLCKELTLCMDEIEVTRNRQQRPSWYPKNAGRG